MEEYDDPFYVYDEFSEEQNESEQTLIPDELIREMIQHMDNKTFKRFAATNKYIKYVCEQDYLSPIINKNMPALLMYFSLDVLNNISVVNRRINNIVRSNDFWYLKLEYDYPTVKRFAMYQSYVGKIVHQDIVQNSMKYYLFYKEYDNYTKNNIVENTPDILIKFLNELVVWKSILTSVLLMMLSLVYKDTSLDKRILNESLELLSVNTLISCLFPSTYSNFCIADGIYYFCAYDHYGIRHDAKSFTPFPQIDVNISSLIHMYKYLNK